MQSMSERQYAAHVGLSRGAIQKPRPRRRTDGCRTKRGARRRNRGEGGADQKLFKAHLGARIESLAEIRDMFG